MSMVVSFMPGMESNAAELSGEDQVTATLQDENSQRLEETTAMDEDGAIYEIHEEKGNCCGRNAITKMQCFWQKHPGRVK